MADDSQQIGQDEIERLLKEAQGNAASSTPPANASTGDVAGAASESGGMLGQNEIEALLKGGGAAPSSNPRPSHAPTAPSPGGSSKTTHHSDIEYLLHQAEQALASVNAPVTPPGVGPVQSYMFTDFASTPATPDAATLELIRDVELDLKIELGRTQMYLEDVLRLKKGSVVALDKLAGDPVDIYVNGRLIARGEVLVMNDNFCVRVAELIAGEQAA